MSKLTAIPQVTAALQTKAAVPKAIHMSKNQQELEKAAHDFEGYFMDMVMQSMRATVQEDHTYGDSQQTKFFQTMLDTEFTKISSQRGSIGLADAIVRQMSPHLGDDKKTP